MSALRNAVCGLALAAAMSAPAFAQSYFLYYPEGNRMVMGHLDKEGLEMAMKHAKPVANPMMLIVTPDGKAMMVENMNEKMPNGKTMAEVFDRRPYP